MIAEREVLKNRQSQKYHVHRQCRTGQRPKDMRHDGTAKANHVNLHTEAWCTVAVPMCLWRQALPAQAPPSDRVVGICEEDQEGLWLIHRVARA
jgi:hypothetical protein